MHDLREIVNAILYVNRTGIRREYLPHDFPPYETVYDYYATWEADGTTQQVHDLLRDKIRRSHGRSTQPTAAVIDVQSVKTSANVTGTGQGIDVGKKLSGTGFYSRAIKRLGAADVLTEMVAAARAIEERAPLGVRHTVADVAGFPAPERPFDAASAVYLLNYAEDAAAMERMCRAVHCGLRPGARFSVLVPGARLPFRRPVRGRVRLHLRAAGPGPDGARVRITALLDPPVEFTASYPRREVYEQSLHRAGFRGITWVPLHVSGEGLCAFGAERWADFLANPPLAVFHCRA